MVILIIIPSVFPAEWAITQIMASIGLSAKLMLIIVVLAAIRVEGKHVFDFAELATKGTPWNMLMMTVTIMAFVGLLATPATGLSAFLGSMLAPILMVFL